MDLSELYQTFFDEADELLDDMERLLIALDPAAPDAEELNAIFRAAHSIKGGAGTFGFTALQETTHLLENLLDRARCHEIDLTRAMVDTFLETRDMLKDQVDTYRDGQTPDEASYQRICATLRQLADEEKAPPEAAGDESAKAASAGAASAIADEPAAEALDADKSVDEPRTLEIRINHVTAEEQTLLADELALFGEILAREHQSEQLVITLSSAESTDDIEAVLCFIVDAGQIAISTPPEASAAGPATDAPVAAAAAEPAAPASNAPAAAPADASTIDSKPRAAASAPRAEGAGHVESSSLRVATDKIDRIINLVGELVITQSMLEQTATTLERGEHGALSDGMAQLQRNARDLQEAVMSIRMMPMDYAFNRFPRLVRDLGRKLGKEVELETVGAATELDKGLIERIMDPLTHLVRNSLDHGIEAPEVREAAGKPRVGRLTLAAQHQGGNILIEIRDDGAGLSRERILSKARANGLEVSDGMPDDEVWQLIFAPGFSTAEAVTDVSGRGVGMDVVKRNIQQLGGRVELSSEFGSGTNVSIALPLTLAIMEGMSVRVGGEVFIMPLGAIMESMQIDEDRVRTVSGNGRVIEVRGEYLPLVELHAVFDVPDAQTDLARGIVMVVQSEGRRCALFVDELIGQQQIVVKNLETHFRKVPGVSAATILGDGSVALILDVIALSRSCRQQRPAATAINAPADVIQEEVV